ncbi:HupE/UreJ family protein [Maricurvus nonylphenolicus]|uniref:HupE/UreJ family protein n=1 Tax=Maricurvus nonylphenolicus TaxID=1008307 RepID=UPI0036F3DFD2
MQRLFFLFALLLFTANGLAHNRSESFSEWSWNAKDTSTTVSFSFSVLQREATRIPYESDSAPELTALLVEHLSQTLSISLDNQSCSVAKPVTALPSREGFLRAEGSFSCQVANSEAAPTIKLDSFFDLLATHTHYAKARHDGEVAEFLFTQSLREQTFELNNDSAEASLSQWQAFSQYLWIGAEHILGGIDHLAFVFALILLAAGWREMAWLITGFTLGHSISLVLAVLQLAKPNGIMVEALIGFTIVLVVVEAIGERSDKLKLLAPGFVAAGIVMAFLLLLVKHDAGQLLVGSIGIAIFSYCYLRVVAVSEVRARWRLLVTSVFGLIHGFGFAGGLLETGFPADQLAFVLLGFNLGVELGQLLVLCLVLSGLYFAQQKASDRFRVTAVNLVAASLSGLGCFWFVSRLLS